MASDITQDRERNAAIKSDTLFGVDSHADHDRDAHYRAGNRNKGIERASVLEFGKCMAFCQKLFAETVMRHANAQPHRHGGETHNRNQNDEYRIRGDHTGNQCQQAADHAERDGVDRNAFPVQAGQPGGHHAFMSQ
ncbi:hypothetical protein NB636_04300 [Oxalobacter aliiformigenes]|nr:hypothetical protein [Oxalobacter aliiformigenes]MCZ4065604.1 hypothetical protein [Oxalobacter aliiformigenes]WAW00070.1 hypothetical protein NB636_04300 [Oxalobacter aliiformigenes]